MAMAQSVVGDAVVAAEPEAPVQRVLAAPDEEIVPTELAADAVQAEIVPFAPALPVMFRPGSSPAWMWTGRSTQCPTQCPWTLCLKKRATPRTLCTLKHLRSHLYSYSVCSYCALIVHCTPYPRLCALALSALSHCALIVQSAPSPRLCAVAFFVLSTLYS